MPKLRVKWSIIWYPIRTGLFITASCALIQNLTTVLIFFFGIQTTFNKIQPNTWVSDISTLKIGSYFLALGRPKAACDILLNDTILLASNKVNHTPLKYSLLLGAPFTITDSIQGKHLTIQCEAQRGFQPALSFIPKITSYSLGQIIQLWQALIELIIGPGSSMVLILFVISDFKINRILKAISSNTDLNELGNIIDHIQYLFFSITSLIYSLSLAHFPRLFFDPFTSTALHITLRNLFAGTFVSLFWRYNKKLKFISYVHAFTILATLIVAHFYPDSLVSFYKVQYVFFILETIFVLALLMKNKKQDETINLFQAILVAWASLQIIDYISFFTLFLGDNFGPLLISVIILAITYTYLTEKSINDRLTIAGTQILEIIKINPSIQEILVNISKILLMETKFGRISTYLDAYCIGRTTKPEQTFLRIFEAGYRKDTSRDDEITLSESRGTYMYKALKNGIPEILSNKATGMSFLILPLSKHVCINLSNNNAEETYKMFEAERVLQKLLPVLRTLEPKLIDMGAQSGFRLNRLRSVYGDGTVEREVSVIIADINDYSKLISRFGSNYSSFVRSTFFSALIRSLNCWATLQNIIGDEICLVSIPELIPFEMTPQSAIIKTIIEFMKFLSTTGTDLCHQHGYPPIQMSIGMSWGPINIHCDPYQVHTTGPAIVESSRLLKAAANNQILIKASLSNFANDNQLAFGDDFSIRNKKDIVTVRPVFIRGNTQNITQVTKEIFSD